MNILGTPSARSEANSLVHGVVRVSSTTRLIEAATRDTTSAAEVRPWEVKP